MKDAGSDRCKDPLDSFQVATAHPRDLVAPNFRVYELTRSDLAIRQGIDNGFETDAQRAGWCCSPCATPSAALRPTACFAASASNAP